MLNNKKNTKTRMLSVEETNAALDKEFAEHNPKAEDLPLKQGESKALEESLQSSSVAAEKAEETVPDGTAVGSDGRPLLNTKGAYFPEDSHESDENARKTQMRLARD
jgi:hypothetical protein